MMRGDEMRKPMVMRDRQTGAATLLVSMVLMVAATLLVLYVSNTVVGEQKMSANEVRSKQAFEGAQAGIELAIERANAGNNFEAASETALNAAWAPENANSSYRVIFCDASVFPAAQTCPDAAGDITRVCLAPQADPGPDEVAGTADDVPATTAWAVGCGWSDDSAARKRIIAMVAKGTPLPGTITNPLTAKGAVFFKGNSTVVNYFNNLTVWTGNNLDNTGNTGKTVIRKPSRPAGQLTSTQVDTQVGDGNQVCNQAADLICTTSSGVMGPDVIQSDQNLANLTEDQFFENFLALPPADYKNTMAEKVVAGAEAGSITEGGKVYWVDGDATIGQNIGTLAKPVILVVDGDLTLSGDLVIFGVVFVRGDLRTNGKPKVRGAVVASGEVDSNGTMNIIYDPDAISNIVKVTGTYATVPGTWRDF